MKFDAVLFDCDGVLVDSEHITNQVLRDMLDQAGWSMTLQECMDVFVGKTVMDQRAQIEQRTGKPLTEAWMVQFRERRNMVLEATIEPIPNIEVALRTLFAATGGRIACASGADKFKVELMLHKVGLLHHLQGRIFSGQETPRNKPHPDVYLAAAAALGVDAKRCAVVEDTITGLTAGVAAGNLRLRVAGVLAVVGQDVHRGLHRSAHDVGALDQRRIGDREDCPPLTTEGLEPILPHLPQRRHRIDRGLLADVGRHAGRDDTRLDIDRLDREIDRFEVVVSQRPVDFRLAPASRQQEGQH